VAAKLGGLARLALASYGNGQINPTIASQDGELSLGEGGPVYFDGAASGLDLAAKVSVLGCIVRGRGGLDTGC
jgi:hypothetical protein